MAARLDFTCVLAELRFIGTHDHFSVANQFALFAHRQTNGRPDFNVSLQPDNGWVFGAPLYAECGQSDSATSVKRGYGQVFRLRRGYEKFHANGSPLPGIDARTGSAVSHFLRSQAGKATPTGGPYYQIPTSFHHISPTPIQITRLIREIRKPRRHQSDWLT
jgi:hypothetical protein